MPLEPAIAELVNDFIAAGRPSPRRQTVAERRAGYVASTILAGEKETRVDVRDVSLEGMTLRDAAYRLSNLALASFFQIAASKSSLLSASSSLADALGLKMMFCTRLSGQSA